MDSILKRLIDQHDVISFDMFDTLVYRKVNLPQDIFDLVDDNVRDFFKVNFNYKKKRIEAEHKARASTQGEITFNEIFRFFPENDSKEIINYAKNTELNIEQNNIVINCDMYKCYNYALENNKRIFIISDMYLSKNFLETILVAQGYKDYEDILVSSEYKLTKESGDLFGFFLEKYKIDPLKVIHVGDNKISDFKQPKIYGLSSYLYIPVFPSMSMQRKSKQYIKLFLNKMRG